MAGIPLIITVLVTLVLLVKAKKNEAYIEEANDLDPKEYALRDIMPIGFDFVDKIGIENLKEKNKKLYNKMVSMYGIDTEIHFRLHMSYKFVLGIVGINVVYFLVLASGSINIAMLIGGPIAGVITYVLADSIQDDQFKKRANQIKYDFPEFITKLVLLVNAGLPLERAWGKILEDSDTSSSPLLFELEKTYRDMNNNIPRVKCLNDLSRRCKVREISKFTSIILQNINKGSSDMVNMLQGLSDECWDERKNVAKQKGEEASTKLLFPMMLMLMTVFMIVLVPALMGMFTM